MKHFLVFLLLFIGIGSVTAQNARITGTVKDNTGEAVIGANIKVKGSTGGTITGVGAYLKKQNPKIKIVAVEPYDSPLLSQGKAGPHGLQGIGANFVPEVLDTNIYDEIITVTTDEAMGAMKALAQNEGLFAGITSGAAVNAAIRLAKRPENKGKTIVAFLPDTGERYLSVLD